MRGVLAVIPAQLLIQRLQLAAELDHPLGCSQVPPAELPGSAAVLCVCDRGRCVLEPLLQHDLLADSDNSRPGT